MPLQDQGLTEALAFGTRTKNPTKILTASDLVQPVMNSALSPSLAVAQKTLMLHILSRRNFLPFDT